MHDWSQFIQTIRDKVAAFPEFVYEQRNGQCFNVKMNHRAGKIEGDCLIGHGLVALNNTFDLQRLWDYERQCRDNDIASIDSEFNLNMPDNVLQWARAVQREQDYGKSWGHALQIADNVVPGIV